jgi:hypothetical protein
VFPSGALQLPHDNLGYAVTDAVAAVGNELDEKLAEASAAIARLVRS